IGRCVASNNCSRTTTDPLKKRRAAMKISCISRRAMLETGIGIAGVGAAAGFGWLTSGEVSYAAALTQEQRDSMTSEQVIAALKQGNERFRAGKMETH